MAYITCPECKNQINEFSLSCSNCGFPLSIEKVVEIKDKYEREFNKSLDASNRRRKIVTPPKEPTQGFFKKQIRIIGVVVVFIILASFYFMAKYPTSDVLEYEQKKIDGYYKSFERNLGKSDNYVSERENSSSSNIYDKYVVNEEVILASTSKESSDMLTHCLVDGDKEAIKEMINNNQLLYLYRNNVVLLVEPKLTYSIVRKEGSTKLLYVNREFLQKQ